MQKKTGKTIKLTDLKLNDGSHGLPKNPRFIKDKRFEALCKSVKENPEFMPPRPIVVDEAGVILGGNMRYRACRELGMTEIPADWVRVVEGLSVEKKRRFIILDNRGFGDDDFDMLANEWEIEELIGAGFDEKELGDLLDDSEKQGKEENIKEQHLILISCKTEEHQSELLNRFLAEGIECKALQS